MRLIYLLLCLVLCGTASALTIEEKKAGFSEAHQELTPEMNKRLQEVNRDLKNENEELQRLYARVGELFREEASPQEFHLLLERINAIRHNIATIQEGWRQVSVKSGHADAYALWHQPETTIGQLVMDYGSEDYVYLMDPEVASLQLSVDSNLLVPRASWGEMLDLILSQNGIGYRQLNPYLRQLIFLSDNKSNVKIVTNKRRDLDLFSPESRVSFVLTPEPAEVRHTWLFLDKFVNPNSTLLQMVGRDILVIGPVAEVKDLLKLYDFVATNKGDKEYKVFPVSRVDPDEMAKILAAIFDLQQGNVAAPVPMEPRGQGMPGDRGAGGPQRPPLPIAPSQDLGEGNGLKVIALGHVARALFLVGTKEEIRKAEQIIKQVESQVGEAREKVIYWYTAKHSDPEELAEVLQKIYILMITTGTGRELLSPLDAPPGYIPPPIPMATADQIAGEIIDREIDMLPSELYATSYYQQGNYVVNPAPVEPRGTRNPKVTSNRMNFLVDPKTGSIAMVVEADILPKIKDLLKKLDVPKRMVQIEALLFERRILRQNDFGLNLLRIGDCASNTDFTCFSFNDPVHKLTSGIVDFLFSSKKTCNFPAYDLAYKFLMTQDDIQINASPSVVAINQTPATIAIVEEISINTGIYNVETISGVTLEKAFTRAQYGITIDITPTIHITDDLFDGSSEPNYVTLETDLTFDTIQGGLNPDRPDVTRRHISNEVRVPDGQTVILGGLRRKNTDDFKEGIPFFGEVPVLGKLFSLRELERTETEMFIFLTPTIITDPLDDFERIKCEEMRRRPGDIPEFLCSLVNARNMEKNRILAGSMRILFGPDPEPCYSPGYFRPSACGYGSGWINDGWTLDCLPCNGEYYGR